MLSENNRAFYVYAIIPGRIIFPESRENPWKKVEGVEFGGPVEFIDIGGFRIIASQVNLEEMKEEDLKNSLQNDPGWVKKNVKRHFAIIEEYSRSGAIIPFKFAVIYKNQESLEKSIIAGRKKISGLLKRLEGKEEWAVKILLNKDEATKMLELSDPEIRGLEEKILVAGQGVKWYLGKKKEKLLEERLNSLAEKQIEYFEKELGRVAKECAAAEAPGQESKDRELVFYQSCLLPAKKSGNLKELIMEAGKNLRKAGLAVELTGPWPPFSFSRL